MALNFPSSPTVGQIFGEYTWDGEKWIGTDIGGSGEGVPEPGVVDIGLFGPVGTTNDLPTFQAAVAFAQSYGHPITIQMEPTHTLVDNTPSDGRAMLITAPHVYFAGAVSGTRLTLQSNTASSRTFFHWIGGVEGSYALASNVAADTATVPLTSGGLWAAGDLLYVFQTNDGAGNARSFVREVRSVAGTTLTLADVIPFAIATTHTLVIHRVPNNNSGFVRGGGFTGKVYFEGIGITGDNSRAVAIWNCREWSYDYLDFANFRGTTPISGATNAISFELGYQNRGGTIRLRNSGSGGSAGVSYRQQCFGTFGDITDDSPAGFGPSIYYGSRCSFGHHHVSGAVQTRSHKIQGGVRHHFNSIDVSNGAATGIYIVLGSDGVQIDAARVHKCVQYGFTISESNNVQVGCLDAQGNEFDLITDNTFSQIGVAYVSNLSKVQLGTNSFLDIGQLHDIANNKTYTYEKGVMVGVPLSWSPTITSTGGTLTSVTPIAAYYTQIGRAVTCLLDFTIANKGTGNSDIEITLPVPAFTAANGYSGGQALNGLKTLSGRLASATSAQLRLYDGTTAIVANGDRFLVQIVYQANANA